MSTSVVNFTATQTMPAHLKARIASLADKYNDLSAGLSRGVNNNRISFLSNRFHFMKGGEVVHTQHDPVLPVVIVGAQQSIARNYYKNGYDSKVAAPPTCWSPDGIKPGTKVEDKQSITCATCPKNTKGSASDGKGKACGYKKRVAVVSVSDLNGTKPVEDIDVWAIDVSSMSLFSPSLQAENKYSLKGYIEFLLGHKLPYTSLVTNIVFDSAVSVPKVFFSPSSYLSEAEMDVAEALHDSEAVADIIRSEVSTPLTAPVTAALPKLEAPVEAPVVKAPAKAPAKAAPPAPPKVKTWQEVALENGADEDDVESIDDAGGPTTEKGRKRWDKLVSVAPPGEAPKAVVVEAPKAAPKAAAVPSDVGSKLAAALGATFDDE